jgi:hypothetical protein
MPAYPEPKDDDAIEGARLPPSIAQCVRVGALFFAHFVASAIAD